MWLFWENYLLKIWTKFYKYISVLPGNRVQFTETAFYKTQ